MQTKKFREETLDYVFLLQQVQERKKFDFVETVRSARKHRCSIASNANSYVFLHSAFSFNA